MNKKIKSRFLGGGWNVNGNIPTTKMELICNELFDSIHCNLLAFGIETFLHQEVSR